MERVVGMGLEKREAEEGNPSITEELWLKGASITSKDPSKHSSHRLSWEHYKIILIHPRHLGQLRRAEFPDEGAEEDEPDAVDGNCAEESCNSSGANSAEAEKPRVNHENSIAWTTRENTDHNTKETFKH